MNPARHVPRLLLESVQRRFLSSSSSFTTISMPSMQTEIEKNLRDRFAPSHIQVINESHMHSVPKNSETHFKVVVVSDAFDSVQLVARHRMVNDCLKEQLQQGVHALSIVTKTPAQWQTMVEQGKDAVEASPKCQGGNKL